MRLEETMVEIELVTGKRGEPHIKSEHIGSFNNAIIGDGGKYVLDSGKKFSYEIVSNNLLRIYDGDAVNQGRHMLIKRGEYVDVPIENGTQSQKRSDIIVLKYKKNTSTGVETAGLDIIKGVPGDVPTDPEYLSTDILTSATEDDMPLYRVYLNGLNIESVEPLFDVLVPIKKMKDMQEEIEQLNSDLAEGIKETKAEVAEKANISDLNNLSSLVANVKGVKLICVYVSSTSVPANGYTDVQVKYGTTVKSVVGAVVSLATTSNAAGYGGISVAGVAGSFGTTQGTIRFFNNTNTGRAPGANVIIVASV